MCVRVCVFVTEREREGERVKGREGRRDGEKREKGCYSSLTLAKVSLSLRCLMTLFGFLHRSGGLLKPVTRLTSAHT